MSAENTFRDAFVRLKSNTPNNIPLGSTISQNNVAREAGLDPSALKKSRFPELISEIQNWISNNRASHQPSKSQKKINREQKRSLQEKIIDLRQQRDHLASLLVEADSTILKLQEQIKKKEHSDQNIERLHTTTSKT